MWLKLLSFLYCSFFVLGTGSRNVVRKQYNDEIEEDFTKRNRIPTMTPRLTTTSDVVVEKFVNSLLASERYLKMIESVERKLSHLDSSLHDRTSTILKYMSELLRTVRTTSTDSPAQGLDTKLRALKSDLETIKGAFTSQALQKSRDNEYHIDSALDSRLSTIDHSLKSVQNSVDAIVTTIAEVKNRQHLRVGSKPEVNGGPDTTAIINEFRKSLLGSKSKKCDCKSERYPTDCHEIQAQGFNVSGIYKIRPDDMEPFYVLCDLVTAGGGWTVFQNRFDGSQDFYKPWHDYEYGFGNLAGEFWLGLDKLNKLTNQKLYELRIELETDQGLDAFAGYSVFTVGPDHEGYRVSTLGTFYGTAGDSLSYHAGQKFSTHDNDNDEWKDGACAVEHGGAWWYKECDKSNLNGKYTTKGEENRGQGIYWISFKGPNVPLTKTKMMIRPLPASKPANDATKRKFLEAQNVKPLSDKDISRMRDYKKNLKGSHLTHSPYKYDNPPLADTYFPNYA